jgi:hypothetical protein
MAGTTESGWVPIRVTSGGYRGNQKHGLHQVKAE